ncbi:MAG: hypothetical protein DWQ06_07110 [Calditrichaeota bacterium]|nr:MAG: hypothetical protein DWQ06_07110 [Calditrichota bacterium]
MLDDGFSQAHLQKYFTEIVQNEVEMVRKVWVKKDGLDKIKEILAENYDVIILPISLNNYSSLFMIKLVHEQNLPIKMVLVSNSRYMQKGLFDAWLAPTWTKEIMNDVIYNTPLTLRLPEKEISDRIGEILHRVSYFYSKSHSVEILKALGVPEGKDLEVKSKFQVNKTIVGIALGFVVGIIFVFLFLTFYKG